MLDTMQQADLMQVSRGFLADFTQKLKRNPSGIVAKL